MNTLGPGAALRDQSVRPHTGAVTGAGTEAEALSVGKEIKEQMKQEVSLAGPVGLFKAMTNSFSIYLKPYIKVIKLILYQ